MTTDSTLSLTRPSQLSYSSISTFVSCPERWYRQYILKEPYPSDPSLVIGRAFHRTMEINFNHKLRYGVDLSVRAVQDAFKMAFDDAVREDEIPLSDTKELFDISWKLVEQYHREQAPTITPAYVERKLEMPLPGKHVKKLIGFVDLITTDGTVIDYKSAAWKWPEAQVNTSLQPTVYGLLLGVESLSFEYHIIVKTDAIRKDKFGDGIYYMRTHRSLKDFEWLTRLILKMIKIIEDPDMYSLIVPSPGNHCMSCHVRKTCGYRTR